MKSLAVAVFAMVFIASAWSTMMAGGIRDVALNDTSVLNALEFAVNQHNNAQNDAYRNDVEKVLKAQSQVVSGVKYTITVQMVRTNCRKNRANEACGPTDPPKNYQCTFVVWSRPWMNDIRVLSETCP